MTTFDMTAAIAKFRAAKQTYETSRLGSNRERTAEATMNRLVAQAERAGMLAEFVTAVTR